MRTNPRFRPFPSAAMTSWLLKLATQALATSLNMPEPVLHGAGAFVFAQVQAVENSVGRKLCPIRLWRQLARSTVDEAVRRAAA